MRYAIADVELTGPQRELRLEADQCGVAVLLRAHGRPVHFSLHAQPPGAHLAHADLLALAGDEPGLILLEEALRAELVELPPTGSPELSVSVVVCTHARTDLLEACLRSVAALTPPPNEVVVVDNAPPDDAAERLVAGLPGVRYAAEPRPGLDFARNRALEEARGEWVAFLDDDVVVDPGWLAGLAEAIEENPDAGVVTGLVLPLELESEAQVRFELRGGFRRGVRKRRFAGPKLPGQPLYPAGAGIFGAGCNMAVRRDVVADLGGFDEALDTGAPLPGGGDLDIFYRVARAGHPIAYEPRMLVFHRHRRDLEALRRQYGSWGEGFMAFVSKSLGADPSGRSTLLRMVAWWLGYELGLLRRSLRGEWGMTPPLALAELAGGLRGLAGGYGRSRRRVAAIRRAHG